jgi:hypothetical protein
MLIWIEGALKPNEFKNQLNNSKFVEHLIKYLESLIHCDFDGLIQDKREEEIYPCCRTVDYLGSNSKNIKRAFLQDVFEVASITSIHKCTYSCFKTNTTECRFGYGN